MGMWKRPVLMGWDEKDNPHLLSTHPDTTLQQQKQLLKTICAKDGAATNMNGKAVQLASAAVLMRPIKRAKFKPAKASAKAKGKAEK